MSEQHEVAQVLAKLNDLKTIRKQSNAILQLVHQHKSTHFIFDPEKMSDAALFVIKIMQNNYPNWDIPYHSRWRHFAAGGIDRIASMQKQIAFLSTEERGKILYELVILSVFLDAGAGPLWHYTELATGKKYSRSEGLALASLSLYQQGMFSNDPNEPLRVDSERLLAINEAELRQGFQVTQHHPLEGIKGRVTLLNQLGITLQKDTQYFGKEKRLGHFYKHILSLTTDHKIATPLIFHAVLEAFNKIWPPRILFQGIPLGDVWTHKGLKTNEPGSEYIPFHKLSQWLTYSLIEPLEHHGMTLTDLEELTGLPEYRNGGLLIDTGVLKLKNPHALSQAHQPGSEIIVEWRALTIALLDELAVLIRKIVHKNTSELPLAKILQGGTWEAGRQMAQLKRAQGLPPLHIISDGTVF